MSWHMRASQTCRWVPCLQFLHRSGLQPSLEDRLFWVLAEKVRRWGSISGQFFFNSSSEPVYLHSMNDLNVCKLSNSIHRVCMSTWDHLPWALSIPSRPNPQQTQWRGKTREQRSRRLMWQQQGQPEHRYSILQDQKYLINKNQRFIQNIQKHR